jgi:hypothetical protein
MMPRFLLCQAAFLGLAGGAALAPTLSAAERPGRLEISELAPSPGLPPHAGRLLAHALELSARGLRYTYGSADPARGGMDCSGTIHHLLRANGWNNVPRQANTLYAWAWQQGRFHAVNSSRLDSFEFAHLRPGDLLFWSGTYDIQRDPPVTHVMLYLGHRARDQRPVMFGASEGRSYDGRARSGVGVFDFVLPRAGSTGRFLGYASLPPHPDLPPPPALRPGATDASSPPAPDADAPPVPSDETASPAAAP